MVGPFMQGFLLLGIMYWYSKSLLTVINDYYRNEFNIKLKSNSLSNQKTNLENIELTTITPDLDNFEELLRLSDDKEKEKRMEVDNYSYNKLIDNKKGGICFKHYNNGYKMFMLIILKIAHKKFDQTPERTFCWLFNNDYEYGMIT